MQLPPPVTSLRSCPVSRKGHGAMKRRARRAYRRSLDREVGQLAHGRDFDNWAWSPDHGARFTNWDAW